MFKYWEQFQQIFNTSNKGAKCCKTQWTESKNELCCWFRTVYWKIKAMSILISFGKDDLSYKICWLSRSASSLPTFVDSNMKWVLGLVHTSRYGTSPDWRCSFPWIQLTWKKRYLMSSILFTAHSQNQTALTTKSLNPKRSTQK
jgi:hypothetical protein